jgi:ribosomal protein S12 methylthiotransferase accessory factor
MARNAGDSLAHPFLETARRAARLCGVTRLADITRLDRIGLPVWQAVRPASRALTVHQGKARTHAEAQIGALCEAVESHCAEMVAPDGPCCPLAALPLAERVAEPGDLLADRGKPPDWDEPVRWCTATDLATGRTLHLPHALVSLDFRSGLPSPFERTSNGLGAGPDETHALRTALLEVIERDALARWRRLSATLRAATRLEPGAIPFGWFQEWRERLASLGAELEAFHMSTLVGVPAFFCQIEGEAAFGTGRRTFSGSAAHADAGTALFKAFAEAAQTRLTLIAGVRDDLYFRHYRPAAEAAEGDGRQWPRGRAWRVQDSPNGSVEARIERLAERGYMQVAVKRLDRGLDGVAVVKAFVPGLGLRHRTRRAPA